MTVQLPGKPVDQDGEDLRAPIESLLRGVEVLPKSGEKMGKMSTPESLQVLRAGALDLTKLWAAAVGAGGLTAIGAAWRYVDGSTGSVKIVFIGSAGVVLAAVALAIAMIVKADVSGRAAATVAQMNARADIAVQFMRSSGDRPAQAPSPNGKVSGLPKAELELLLAFAAHPGKLRAAEADGQLRRVTGVRSLNEGLEFDLDGQDWMRLDRIKSYTTEPAPKP